MADKVYCYPDSDVLINKFGIRDREELATAERKLTSLRILELIRNPVRGELNFQYLKDIHFYIFQDIYDWAGQMRTVNIEKGNMFCNSMFLEDQAEKIFGELRTEDYLAGLGRTDFIKRLAYYFSEINALHPFREGNGRTQREFVRNLALKNNYIVNFAKISEKDMLIASSKSFLCDYEPMEELFNVAVRCFRSTSPNE